MTSGIGPIKWIDHYIDAPENARYILRSLYDTTWVFEEYTECDNTVLKEFPMMSITEIDEMVFALMECRSIIGYDDIIYVEKV